MLFNRREAGRGRRGGKGSSHGNGSGGDRGRGGRDDGHRARGGRPFPDPVDEVAAGAADDLGPGVVGDDQIIARSAINPGRYGTASEVAQTDPVVAAMPGDHDPADPRQGELADAGHVDDPSVLKPPGKPLDVHQDQVGAVGPFDVQSASRQTGGHAAREETTGVETIKIKRRAGLPELAHGFTSSR